ncbi:VUT family protein [Geodermatophilus sp. FMUSA9-8]|uniref:VUT family protein n=1 Tax=Geodermatophilus sp. FMUSA9-8 TaxID=3120155 RepID=UPI00300B04BE
MSAASPWNRRLLSGVLALALLSTVVGANWLVSTFGVIPAGFGLMVPAGTYAAGLALGLRDGLDRLGGFRWVLPTIALGVVLSALLAGPGIAVASAAAFALGELTDLLVWRRLRRSGWRRALVASNAVGAVVDTCVFLPLAGIPLTSTNVGGQVLVKAVYVTASILVLVEIARRVALEVAGRPQATGGGRRSEQLAPSGSVHTEGAPR